MKKCIIVLGMHRSGTSALMGVLKALGVETGSGGSGFIAPYSDNEKGFFELVDIVNLNDRILNSLEASWDSLHSLPENWREKAGLDEYREEIRRVIKTNFKSSNIISIKDPRLCRLLPLWAEMFEETGFDTCFIIPLRNPLEIALSLKTRNGFSQEKSLLLWMLYMLEAELCSREYPRVFITFDGLLKETENIIDSISKSLKIDFPKTYREAKAEVSAFLDAGLRHHHQERVPDDKILTEETLSFYSLLSSFKNKDGKNGDELSKIDNIRNRHLGLRRLFYNNEVADNMRAARKFESLMSEKDLTIAEKDKAIAEKDQTIAEKEWKIIEQENFLAKKERTIAKYESKLIYVPLLKKLEQKIRKNLWTGKEKID